MYHLLAYDGSSELLKLVHVRMLAEAGVPLAEIGALLNRHFSTDSHCGLHVPQRFAPEVEFVWSMTGNIVSEVHSWLGGGPFNGAGLASGYDVLDPTVRMQPHDLFAAVQQAVAD